MNAHSPITGPILHRDLQQGTDEWLEARCGLLTASEMKLIVTPGTLKPASNEKERTHLWELLSQRLTKRVELNGYQSDAMLRGHAEEAEARYLYEQHFEAVETVGFITNSRWGFTLGYSPDGLVGDDGLIEVKSRAAKYQVETLVECLPKSTIPDEYKIQVQTALLITERKWCDFISYSNGMPMVTIRVEPDPIYQEAILAAATAFEKRLEAKLLAFADATKAPGARLIPTRYTPPVTEMRL
jgi:hypothetical protein